jgi:hypothetical protein
LIEHIYPVTLASYINIAVQLDPDSESAVELAEIAVVPQAAATRSPPVARPMTFVPPGQRSRQMMLQPLGTQQMRVTRDAPIPPIAADDYDVTIGDLHVAVSGRES